MKLQNPPMQDRRSYACRSIVADFVVLRVQPCGWTYPCLRKLLTAADPDLVNAMLRHVAQALMSAEADEQCGAEYGERSPDRGMRLAT